VLASGVIKGNRKEGAKKLSNSKKEGRFQEKPSLNSENRASSGVWGRKTATPTNKKSKRQGFTIKNQRVLRNPKEKQ